MRRFKMDFPQKETIDFPNRAVDVVGNSRQEA